MTVALHAAMHNAQTATIAHRDAILRTAAAAAVTPADTRAAALAAVRWARVRLLSDVPLPEPEHVEALDATIVLLGSATPEALGDAAIQLARLVAHYRPGP